MSIIDLVLRDASLLSMRSIFKACLILVLSLPAFAQPTAIPVGPDLAALGWKELTFKNIPATSFVGRTDGVIEVRADKSSSVLYIPIEGDARNARTLSWSWQVIDGVPATDLRTRDGDDRNLTIHVAFADGNIVSKFLGLFSPFAGGRALNYVWGGAEVADFSHPHLPDDAWIYVRHTADAPLDTWFTETVDLAADYKEAFGEDPPAIAAIGISSDADSLRMTTFAMVRDITLD